MTVLDDQNFEFEILNYNGLAVVDFWAGWCPPCKALAPIMDRLTEMFPDVKVGKMNVDENSIIPEKYSISALPTILFFKNGQMIKTFVGLRSENELKHEIEGQK